MDPAGSWGCEAYFDSDTKDDSDTAEGSDQSILS